jgi:hypothetical protein
MITAKGGHPATGTIKWRAESIGRSGRPLRISSRSAALARRWILPILCQPSADGLADVRRRACLAHRPDRSSQRGGRRLTRRLVGRALAAERVHDLTRAIHAL